MNDQVRRGGRGEPYVHVELVEGGLVYAPHDGGGFLRRELDTLDGLTF
ncbi:MAG: hypothetical protein JRI23_11520 [Deltaproteobacteria bacterium]|nr:hypothetical protein [Deltaproteobacteria bacterium]MBW2532327.1 hypothetical protein [Deltaproteobacteria bacterium]